MTALTTCRVFYLDNVSYMVECPWQIGCYTSETTCMSWFTCEVVNSNRKLFDVMNNRHHSFHWM